MTHANEFLKQCFHAYYGADAVVNDNRPHPATRIKKMTGVTDTDFVYAENGNPINGGFDIQHCQLLLTPLSKITDEDAIEVCGIIGWDADGKGKLLSCKRKYNKVVFDFEMNIYKVGLSIEIIDFLRLKKYDVGYLHLPSLIEAGIAVEATK